MTWRVARVMTQMTNHRREPSGIEMGLRLVRGPSGHDIKAGRGKMKLLDSAIFALGALTIPAAAADMPTSNRAPIPAFNWTGFYVGGDIGVASTTNNAEWNPTSASGVPSGVMQVSGGTGGASFAGGGIGGYNWQFASGWVTGVEADWTGMKAGSGLTQPWLANAGGVVPGGFTTLSSELEWTASIRGRLGYLIRPSFLAYATAGIAWGNFQYRANSINSVSGYATGVTISNTETGWVAGIGFEWAPFASSGLLLRAEYLNYGFGGAQATSTANGFPALPSAYSWSSPNVSLGRIGASYKL
jgi:outer membrane immunogenic protein